MIETDPSRRRYKQAFIAGIYAGLLSAIVKFGWEVPFPPRSPERNLTNPPQEFLQQLGFSESFTHSTYTILGNQMPWVSFIVHFGFSIIFALIYCLVAEKYPVIKKMEWCSFWSNSMDRIPCHYYACFWDSSGTMGSAYGRAPIRSLWAYSMVMVY